MGILTGIGRKFKSVSRYNQILKVLIKYGFEDLVQHLEERNRYTFLRKLIPKSSRKHALIYNKWEKMRMVCEELGPTFVKFGQILSNRPDLIPLELTLELEKLQDKVPPMSEEDARKVVEEELGEPVADLFAWFEPSSFASASMAQVHKVILHSGKRVALKIQRPGIDAIILEDIKVMYKVAHILEKRIPSLENFDPVGLVKNFEESIIKEMDFINESVNVQRFYNNLQNDKSRDQFASAPSVYQEFTTQKILALEFINGIKIDRLDELQLNGFDKNVIARRLTKSFFKQIFEYGFFHADPHPGNLLVLPDGRICYLDFGMMGNILPRDIEIFGKLFLAITRKDVNKIIKALQLLSNEIIIKDIRSLEYAITEFVEKYYAKTVHKNEMSTILMELKDIIVAHGLKVPSYFFLFARSLVTLEGVVQKLDPELDQFEIARPYLTRAVSKNFDPLMMGERLINSIYELSKYMEEFPRDLKNVIRKINSGQIKVDLTHRGIDPMVHTINRVTKQLVSAFIIVALIIGAALFISAEVKPIWTNTSIFGIICIVLAVIVGMGMLRDISKGDYDR
ncbi:MAG: AarF/ABC1/UbiB kinase family protein [Flavobacterium sp.]|nr:MAG: AarF/ABC1/UbiB kinase family protein [Flavobacterium sp.]